jgi:quinol monooxygenase YgiN
VIVVSGIIEIDPAHTEAALAAIQTVVDATLQEDGCIAYGFWTQAGAPARFHVFEEWASEEAMNAHMTTPHLGEFLVAMGGFGITTASLDRYDVSAKSKLM